MAVWKIAKVGRVSSVTGAALPPDTEVVAALFGEEQELSDDKVRGGGFTRRDFLVSEATPERLAGAFCVWHTRTPPERPVSQRPLDLELAREFLERLLAEGSERRAGVAMALALLLVRKRRLTLVEQRGEGADGVLVLHWPKEETLLEVPAPTLTDAEAEGLQQELLRLFDV